MKLSPSASAVMQSLANKDDGLCRNAHLNIYRYNTDLSLSSIKTLGLDAHFPGILHVTSISSKPEELRDCGIFSSDCTEAMNAIGPNPHDFRLLSCLVEQ
ncbi:Peroxisome biogenesis protein 1 [Senna tora]|uniref:Peroxisome biogenesis protein 1 n=1 Tax=Senna tora TaxID=362788 RepID=A0A834WSJ9_9FABA|nr:Peroxisome biogenesis protein 1 [Senna tora]